MHPEMDTGDDEREMQAQGLDPGEFLFCSISRDAIQKPDRHKGGFFKGKS